MSKRHTVIILAMRIDRPRRVGPDERKAYDRLDAAGAFFESLTNNGADLDLDGCHLTDAADTFESLVNVFKRARACQQEDES